MMEPECRLRGMAGSPTAEAEIHQPACTESESDPRLHAKRRDTQVFYARYTRMLVDKAGDVHLRDIFGGDVRRWHAEWTRDHGVRSAYACIQALRRVISYGCELRNDLCYDLAKMIERMEFKAPRSRKSRPTYQQIVAFRAAAHAAGRPSITVAHLRRF